MGTSVNQRSPSTLNWRLVETGYVREEIPIDRLTQEIWRAAQNQTEGNLLRDLAEPIIAQCVGIVSKANNRTGAIQQIRLAVIQAGKTSLAVEIAQRAATLAFQSAGNRTNSFIETIFSEAGNYLVSRDIPGFVGLGRLTNVSDALALKNDIRSNIIQKVGEVPRPTESISDSGVWREYVNRIVTHISGGIS